MKLNINEEISDQINEVLGISDQRDAELKKIAKENLLGFSRTHTTAFSNICEKCENLEEVVNAIYHYGVMKAKIETLMEKMKGSMGGLSDVL